MPAKSSGTGNGPRSFDPRGAGSCITLIFQELNNCPNLKAIENLFLGREIFRGRSPFLDGAAMRRKALELFDYLDVGSTST